MEGQRQVAGLFTLLFSEEMLSLTDEELQAQAEKLQEVYASDPGEEFVMEVRLLRHEFRLQLQDCQSVKDVLELLVSTHMLSSMPEFWNACVLFCTLLVTVSCAERSFSKFKLIKSYFRATLADIHVVDPRGVSVFRIVTAGVPRGYARFVSEEDGVELRHDSLFALLS